jgi:nucleoside-diphosphate-sugar epimerase
MASASGVQRIVVTGAGGFVGGALVRHLHAIGKDVVAMSRATSVWPAGVIRATIDSYENPTALRCAVEHADAVVHLAARAHQRGPTADFECNERAAQVIAQASQAAGVRRLILMSSIGVNGNLTHGQPFVESDLPSPVEPYAVSKLRSEAAVIDNLAGSDRTDYVILRPPLIYGPRAPGNFARLVRAIESGWVLPLAGIRNARSLLGLGNLLELLSLCLEHPAAANQLLLVADGEDVSTPDLVRHMARGLGKPARLARVPPSLLRAAAQILGQTRLADSLCGSLQIDASKARQLLGWVPGHATVDGIEQAARESARPC